VEPRGIAIGGNDTLYWTSADDGGAISACGYAVATGCVYPSVTSTKTPPGEIVADEKNAYVTLPDENRVIGFDDPSNPPKEVAIGQNHPTFLALDERYVYWVDIDGLKRCSRAADAGCGSAPTFLTPLPLQPGGIAVTSAGVIYGALRAVDRSGKPVASGAVYRFFAPP
jgi:hypothetical protein